MKKYLKPNIAVLDIDSDALLDEAISNYDDDGPLFSCESSFFDPDGFNYELKVPGSNILSTMEQNNKPITIITDTRINGTKNILSAVPDNKKNEIINVTTYVW